MAEPVVTDIGPRVSPAPAIETVTIAQRIAAALLDDAAPLERPAGGIVGKALGRGPGRAGQEGCDNRYGQISWSHTRSPDRRYRRVQRQQRRPDRRVPIARGSAPQRTLVGVRLH